jgi:hypothetical protein
MMMMHTFLIRSLSLDRLFQPPATTTHPPQNIGPPIRISSPFLSSSVYAHTHPTPLAVLYL